MIQPLTKYSIQRLFFSDAFPIFFQAEYYKSLATIANLKPLPEVLSKLHETNGKRLKEDFINYRNDVYRIVDDQNFVKIGSSGWK